ncbi:MAG TPA: ABC-2 family transporter protein [Acidimicrobiia bacterium]|nr:ABC-2 family transporter protein [Acidimicrobiia bacterium]
MRKYLALSKGSFMTGMVYRFGFIATIVGNILYMVIAYYLWTSVYDGQEVINGLSFDQTFLYVALASTVFILFNTYVDWLMSFEIREGRITNYLVKPIDHQLAILASGGGRTILNILIVTVPTALLLTFVFGVAIPVGAGLLLFPVSLFLAFLISFCFDYAVGLTGFYTESIWGLVTVKETLILALSGALIPIQFFPEGLQNLLRWLPFSAIYHTPLMMITQPDQGLGLLLERLAFQFLWVGTLFVFTRLFYNRAIRVLRVAGG